MHELPAPSIAVSDVGTLRALSHPVRLALLEALQAGPLTATEAGELIDESATTCSFHLRQLARHGLVEEAGRGRGRARPWRLVHEGWRAPARPEDPDLTRAVQALDRIMLDRYVQRIRRFVDLVATYPTDWQTAATATVSTLHLTAAELAELAAAYRELIEKFRKRWADRNQYPDRRPANSLPVDILFGAYPVDSRRSPR